jgi:hypothetical protein
MFQRSLTALAALAVAGAGCADSINRDNPDAALPDDAAGNDAAGDAAPPAGKVVSTRASDGTYTTIVDATAMTGWTYVDFETGGELPATGPWDLRFQRFHISANGGVTGTGGVEVAAVTGVAFADVTAPATGFVSDAADGNGDGVPDYVLDQGDAWYAYSEATHVLMPRPIVWVVKTAGGSTVKLEIVSYYDTAGTSGTLTLHWGTL